MQVLWIGVLISVLAVTAGAAPVTSQRVEGLLALEASVAKRTYAPGEAVEIVLTVRNTGSAPVAVTFTSGQQFEFIVRRPRGDEVWRWSHDQAFIQVVQSMQILPQGSLTFRRVWDQQDLQGRRVDPGSYEAIAEFRGHLEGGRPAPIQLPSLTFTITK